MTPLAENEPALLPETRSGARVVGAFIDTLDWAETLGRLRQWATMRESRYVCICNVHSVVTARRDPEFGRVVAEADMAAPDGMPVVWMLRRRAPGQERINGPDMMLKYCALAERSGEKIFLYGSVPSTLELLVEQLKLRYPRLQIAGMHSPPFRTETAEEDAEIVSRINESGAGVVFISLGCPKQELWMAEHRGRISAVMIGVGAAFDYHAGTVKRAPVWMQRSGLEWIYRVFSEPRRLWRRYLVTNSLFIYYVLAGLVTRNPPN